MGSTSVGAADVALEERYQLCGRNVGHVMLGTSHYTSAFACAGVAFLSVELVKHLVSSTATATGLRATVDVLDQAYETGLKVAADFKATMRMGFDEVLSKWNYVVKPAAAPA